MKTQKLLLITFILTFLFSSPSFSKILVADHKIAVTSAKGYNFVTRKPDKTGPPVFKTIQQAIDAAGEGDTVVVRQGFYNEALIINKNGLTLRNFNNEKAIIDGNNPRLGPLVKIEASDITLSGLTVMHSSSFGIYSIGNNNITVENCEVAYSEDGGIVFVRGENILIDGCIVHHNNYKGLQAAHEGITLRGVKHFEVKNCEVFDNKEEGIDSKYGSMYGKIHHNRLYRNNGPQIYVDISNHIEIYNNIIYDAVSKSGISLNIESTWKPEDVAWTQHNISVYNNLIYNNHGGIGFWLEPGRGSEENAHWDSIYIFNNTLVNNAQPNSTRGGGIYIVNGELHNFGNELFIINNIIWEKSNGASRCIRDDTHQVISKFTISHNIFPAGEPTDVTGENPVIAYDIHFVDAYNNDYRLLKNSPAIGAGDPNWAPKSDIANKLRKEKNSDAGAYASEDK